MKAYHLVLSPSGDAASPLHFLDRGNAAKYQNILLWPWKPLGYYQAPNGERMALDKVTLRVESVTLPGIFDPDLDWILWKQDAVLGFVPLVPGRCFDPGAWRAASEHDLKDPTLAPKIAHAERELEDSLK